MAEALVNREFLTPVQVRFVEFVMDHSKIVFEPSWVARPGVINSEGEYNVDETPRPLMPVEGIKVLSRESPPVQAHFVYLAFLGKTDLERPKLSTVRLQYYGYDSPSVLSPRFSLNEELDLPRISHMTENETDRLITAQLDVLERIEAEGGLELIPKN